LTSLNNQHNNQHPEFVLNAFPPATVDDGERCYHAEFEGGECWWGTNNGRGEEDGTLYQILMEMDVHRVGFGIKSSWIVIGKNGEVAWKSIPQKSHDVLVAQYIPSTFSSLCETTPRRNFTKRERSNATVAPTQKQRSRKATAATQQQQGNSSNATAATQQQQRHIQQQTTLSIS
jgi:hypothetical protein